MMIVGLDGGGRDPDIDDEKACERRKIVGKYGGSPHEVGPRDIYPFSKPLHIVYILTIDEKE
jgi:hypothetical protein